MIQILAQSASMSAGEVIVAVGLTAIGAVLYACWPVQSGEDYPEPPHGQ